MTTYEQDKELGQDVFGLVTNYDVDDVYDKDTILTYVKDNYTVDEVFDEGTIKQYVSSSFSPEDVFSTNDLECWALENSFVEGE